MQAIIGMIQCRKLIWFSVAFLIPVFHVLGQNNAEEKQDTSIIYFGVSVGPGFLKGNLNSGINEVDIWLERLPSFGPSVGISIKNYGPKGIGFGLVANYNSIFKEVELESKKYRHDIQLYNLGMGVAISKKSETFSFDGLPFIGFGLGFEQLSTLGESSKNKTNGDFLFFSGVDVSLRFRVNQYCHFLVQGTSQLGVAMGSSGSYINNILRFGISTKI